MSGSGSGPRPARSRACSLAGLQRPPPSAVPAERSSPVPPGRTSLILLLEDLLLVRRNDIVPRATQAATTLVVKSFADGGTGRSAGPGRGDEPGGRAERDPVGPVVCPHHGEQRRTGALALRRVPAV